MSDESLRRRLTAANESAAIELTDDRALFEPEQRTFVRQMVIPAPIRTTTPPGTGDDDDNNNNNEDDEQSKIREFEQLGLLTQYIGPRRTAIRDTERPHSSSRGKDLEKEELDKLKRKYLQKAEICDRATSHLEALDKVVDSGRIPAKLKITTKPLVVNKDDPRFQSEWQAAIRQSENSLIDCIRTHLNRVIDNTNEEIRELTQKSFLTLRSSKDLERTSAKLKDTIREAEANRHEANESRKRKRQETWLKQQQQQKRAKKDNQPSGSS